MMSMVWVVDILIMELSDFEMLTGYMMFKCAMRVDLLSQPTYKCNKPYTCDILLHDAKTSPKSPHPRKMLIHGRKGSVIGLAGHMHASVGR
jgi:hypothetical protein